MDQMRHDPRVEQGMHSVSCPTAGHLPLATAFRLIDRCNPVAVPLF
jgi:hypothetical protein